jgi:hypothetical protein
VDGIEIPGYEFPVAKGSKDGSVKDIQKALIDMGYLDDVADGIYGNNTENAIIAYCDDYNATLLQQNPMAVLCEYDGYLSEELYVQIKKDYILWMEDDIAA